jgi:tRNA modification GTPase
VLLLVDARSGIADADREILSRLPARLQRITVYNKIDLAGRTPERHDEHDAHGDAVAISLSAKANQGIELLRNELLRIAGWHQTEDVFIARERHLRALASAQEHIAAARAVVKGHLPALELFAEELRLAQQALGEITGEFTADDLLGVIFSRFCIGK